MLIQTLILNFYILSDIDIFDIDDVENDDIIVIYIIVDIDIDIEIGLDAISVLLSILAQASMIP